MTRRVTTRTCCGICGERGHTRVSCPQRGEETPGECACGNEALPGENRCAACRELESGRQARAARDRMAAPARTR